MVMERVFGRAVCCQSPYLWIGLSRMLLAIIARSKAAKLIGVWLIPTPNPILRSRLRFRLRDGMLMPMKREKLIFQISIYSVDVLLMALVCVSSIFEGQMFFSTDLGSVLRAEFEYGPYFLTQVIFVYLFLKILLKRKCASHRKFDLTWEKCD